MSRIIFHRRTGVILIGLLALIGGLATGRDIFFNITYLIGLLLIVSFAWAWSNINWVYLSRVTRTRRTQVGRPLEERFTVRNTSIIPKLWLEIRDFSNAPGHFASKVVNSLGGRSGYSWRISTICRIRGRFRLGPLTISTSDPFGLFPMERQLAPTTHVVVYPKTVDVHQFALPIGLLPGGDALRRRTHYVTTNASGVRDYAPGDSFSRIHWPSTARRERLIVKEFELDPLADIWIAVDMAAFTHVRGADEPRDKAASPDELREWMPWKDEDYQLPALTEEYSVTIAASLAQYFLRHDRAVGLIAQGQTHEIVQPDRGERQLNRILETLAVLRAEGQVAIESLLDAESQILPRGTTLITITPTHYDTWLTMARQLTRRGLRVVTISIDPASFGAKYSSASLASLLQASNLITYLVRYDDNLTSVLSAGNLRSSYFIRA